ncbi:MAG: hypothetical protein GXO81_03175 [Chlorobi bacterium]|nr:hypothetical protein [Chlorobiota bacterium]
MKRFILILMILAPMFLFGQDEIAEKEVKTFGVGTVPQYAFSNGARIDFDFRLKRKGQWLVVAPQVYLNNGNSNLWNFDELIGAGIDLQHKFFFKDNPVPRGAYFAYGTVFQYFSVKDEGLKSYGFEEGGSMYYGLNKDMTHTNIYKIGGNLLFGMQAVISDFLYLDAYIGTGIRLSFDDRTSGLHGYYNDWWGDLGYSGTLIVAGIRFGIYL